MARSWKLYIPTYSPATYTRMGIESLSDEELAREYSKVRREATERLRSFARSKDPTLRVSSLYLEKKNLYLTELGQVVNDMMKQAFPSIVDVSFTANMETLLDGVGTGQIEWKVLLENFWPDLYAAVKEAEKELQEVKIEDEKSDVICEECGRTMVIKYGPHGKFLACPGFPECRNTKPYLEKIGVKCPLCGGDVLRKRTKKGRQYFGCEKNPECSFMSWQRPSSQKCPQCGSYMLEKGNKLVCADKECGFVMNREKDGTETA